MTRNDTRRPSSYQFDGYIVDHAQYWTGRSTAHTRWSEVYVGVGSTPRAAADDALDTAAQDNWTVDDVHYVDADWPDTDCEGLYSDDDGGDSEVQYYAVLWLREVPAQPRDRNFTLYELAQYVTGRDTLAEDRLFACIGNADNPHGFAYRYSYRDGEEDTYKALLGGVSFTVGSYEEDSVDEANKRAILRDFDTYVNGDPARVLELYPMAYTTVFCFDFRGLNTVPQPDDESDAAVLFRELLEMLENVDGYPVIDDELHSAVENERFEAEIEDAVHSAERGCDEEINVENLTQRVYNALRDSDVYYQDGGTPGLEELVKECLASMLRVKKGRRKIDAQQQHNRAAQSRILVAVKRLRRSLLATIGIK